MPGLAWEACLKHSDRKLELISDIDMLLMIEKGIRGGICQSMFRNAKVNNKYMIDYDEILIIIIYIENQCQKNCLNCMDMNG